MYGSWDMVSDRRMEGQKKWHIEVGAPTKNHKLIGLSLWTISRKISFFVKFSFCWYLSQKDPKKGILEFCHLISLETVHSESPINSWFFITNTVYEDNSFCWVLAQKPPNQSECKILKTAISLRKNKNKQIHCKGRNEVICW